MKYTDPTSKRTTTLAKTLVLSGRTGPTLKYIGTIAYPTIDGSPAVSTYGQVVHYTFTVKNTGNVTLTNPVLTDSDPLAPPTLVSGDTNNNRSIDPGETWTYSASHTVTQVRLRTGAAPDRHGHVHLQPDEPPNHQRDAHHPASRRACRPEGGQRLQRQPQAGTVITDRYIVSNNGTTPISGVTLTDSDPLATPKLDATVTKVGNVTVTGDTNKNGELDPGEVWAYTATHTVTQAEMNAGAPLTDVVTASSGAPTVTSSATATMAGPTGFTLQTITDPNYVAAPGTSVAIYYEVTNNSTSSLSTVLLLSDNGTPNDPSDDPNFTFQAPAGDTNHNGKLDPGETWEYESFHTVTQAEYDAGTPLVVTAKVFTPTMKSDGTAVLTWEYSSDTITINKPGGLNIVKWSMTDNLSPATVAAAGQTVTYLYTLANTGTTPLSGITLTDDNATPNDTSDDYHPTYDTTFGSIGNTEHTVTITGDTNGNGLLDPGEVWAYTATHVVTQAEFTAGLPLVNTVTATYGVAYSAATVTVNRASAMTVQKTADKSYVDTVGQAIHYTYSITNTGNTTLSGVALTDDNGTPANPADDIHFALNPGNPLTNTVTATSNESGPAYSGATVTVEHTGGLCVVKTADKTVVTAAGQTINYTYTVTNGGATPLSNVTLVDGSGTPTLQPGGDANGNGKLDPTETWIYKSSHVVSAAEFSAGTPLTSTVTATATNQAEPA